jgi:hypothetical protein
MSSDDAATTIPPPLSSTTEEATSTALPIRVFRMGPFHPANGAICDASEDLPPAAATRPTYVYAEVTTTTPTTLPSLVPPGVVKVGLPNMADRNNACFINSAFCTVKQIHRWEVRECDGFVEFRK